MMHRTTTIIEKKQSRDVHKIMWDNTTTDADDTMNLAIDLHTTDGKVNAYKINVDKNDLEKVKLEFMRNNHISLQSLPLSLPLSLSLPMVAFEQEQLTSNVMPSASWVTIPTPKPKTRKQNQPRSFAKTRKPRRKLNTAEGKAKYQRDKIVKDKRKAEAYAAEMVKAHATEIANAIVRAEPEPESESESEPVAH